MAWWTADYVMPKAKSRFIVNFGSFFLPNIKSITKPSVEFSTKEFKLLNHTFNYPGTAKWNPITVKFICMNPSDLRDASGGIPPGHGGLDTADLLWQMLVNTGYYIPTADFGHKLGRKMQGVNSKGEVITSTVTSITTPEKASTVANAFGNGLFYVTDYTPGGSWNNDAQRVIIQQLTTNSVLDPNGTGKIRNLEDLTREQRIDKTPGTKVTEQWELVNPIIKKIDFGDLDYSSDDFVEYSMDIVYDYAEYKNWFNDDGPLVDNLYNNYSST